MVRISIFTGVAVAEAAKVSTTPHHSIVDKILHPHHVNGAHTNVTRGSRRLAGKGAHPDLPHAREWPSHIERSEKMLLDVYEHVEGMLKPWDIANQRFAEAQRRWKTFVPTEPFDVVFKNKLKKNLETVSVTPRDAILFENLLYKPCIEHRKN